MFENSKRMQEKITYFPFVAGEMLEEHRKTVADQLRGEMTRTMRSRASKFNAAQTLSMQGSGDRSVFQHTPKHNVWLKQDLSQTP